MRDAGRLQVDRMNTAREAEVEFTWSRELWILAHFAFVDHVNEIIRGSFIAFHFGFHTHKCILPNWEISVECQL